jgi:hypothetical protein
MSTPDTARRLEAEDLARAKSMTQSIIGDWDLFTWNDLLANDVVLSLRLGSIGIDRIGDWAAVGGNLQVEGREDVRPVLNRRNMLEARPFCSRSKFATWPRKGVERWKRQMAAKGSSQFFCSWLHCWAPSQARELAMGLTECCMGDVCWLCLRLSLPLRS